MKYLKVEHLKCKKRWIKYLIFLAPCIVLLHAGLTYLYFIPNGYNWWYIMLLPGYLALSSSLLNRYEQKGLGYRAVISLPISLKKTWIAKILLLAIYLSLSSLFHLVILILGKATIYSEPAKDISYLSMVFASMTLIITYLWQIPFCLVLSKKIGTAFTVFINVVFGMAMNILFVHKSYWWICPYSWGSRLMIPIIKVLPNGLLAETVHFSDYQLDIVLGLTLSVLLFLILTWRTATRFQRQEAD
ncbi:MAG: lantibiotic immunity ABC transporter MutE/EpiE family permease subunit [Tissierellia bacterium]|nr:lantibiotic immunity ABC transporter MutE/EpiE family permease subunit [Tissierellia bacterium]